MELVGAARPAHERAPSTRPAAARRPDIALDEDDPPMMPNVASERPGGPPPAVNHMMAKGGARAPARLLLAANPLWNIYT